MFQGYLVNWEIEKQVWDYVYGKNCMNVSWCLFQEVDVQYCFDNSSYPCTCFYLRWGRGLTWFSESSKSQHCGKWTLKIVNAKREIQHAIKTLYGLFLRCECWQPNLKFEHSYFFSMSLGVKVTYFFPDHGNNYRLIFFLITEITTNFISLSLHLLPQICTLEDENTDVLVRISILLLLTGILWTSTSIPISLHADQWVIAVNYITSAGPVVCKKDSSHVSHSLVAVASWG